jgi:hypothetical protein
MFNRRSGGLFTFLFGASFLQIEERTAFPPTDNGCR